MSAAGPPSGTRSIRQRKYQDAQYQDVHINLFSKSIIRPLKPVLPPGVSQGEFDLAIKEWSDVVGSHNVFSGQDVQEYIDPYELNEDAANRRVPSGAVWYAAAAYPFVIENADRDASPSTLEEAKRVLRIANKFKIPLWTFSRGKNLGFVSIFGKKFQLTVDCRYGGPAPRLSGSVALDLHRMNHVIEINEEFSYAVVEPGVTFTDLYNYCKERDLRVWPSVPSLGWGSVVGNVQISPAAVNPVLTQR